MRSVCVFGLVLVDSSEKKNWSFYLIEPRLVGARIGVVRDDLLATRLAPAVQTKSGIAMS